MKKKILILTNTYPSEEKPYAGMFVKNQVEELRRRKNYDISLFAMSRAFTGPIGSVAKYLIAALRFFPRVFRQYDVLHLHFFFPFIWLVVVYKLIRPGTRVMLTVHGSDIRGRFENELLRRVHRYAVDKVDYVQAVGYGLAEEFSQIFGRGVDGVFPAGVNRRIFRVKKAISEKKRYDFIFVGSFVKNKGVNMILDAISLLDNPELTYCFIGSGPEEIEIRHSSDSNNIIIFNDLSQKAIAESLNESRYFLLPSRFESFGLAVTEALYCGVPCVVSNVGGLREQVKDGVNGIFIESLDARGVASAMQKALDMPSSKYKEMQQSAEQSNEVYSLDNVINKLELTYQSLMDGSAV